MRRAGEQLSQASHKLAEAMYAKASQQQSANSGEAKQQDSETSGGGDKKKKDDVVDADFEEVKE
jgi:molecular chaperone DnaK